MTMNIKEVTLYQSGVGFFHADCPEKDFILPVNEQDINDVLKSLSVNGLESVRFNSAEEMYRVLDKLGINIETEGALLSICSHLIGLEVDVEVDKKYTGIVMGVDDIEDDTETKDVRVVNEVLVLKIGDEIRNFPLAQIKNLELKDPIIQKDISSYLDFIANKRKAGVVNLHISAKPKTWATWVMPVSSWRLSYRAFYNTESKELDLFGISVIDNTTSIDWEKVVLRLVTGKPISFQYDLFNPLYVKRPEVARDVKGVAPMVSEIGGAFDEFTEAEEEYDMAADLMPLPPPAAAPKKMDKAKGGSRARGMQMFASGAEVPEEKQLVDIKPTIETVKLEIGSAIAYQVSYPLTITRSQSALIPILNEKKIGDLCVVLRDDRLTEAMDAIMLPEPIDLEKGATTIYLDGVFAGDSMLVNGTEFLAFRLNQDLSAMKDMETKSKIEGFEIEGAYLNVKRTSTKTHTFKFINRAKEKQLLYLEVQKIPNYKPDAKFDAETKNYYRYKLDLKAGNTVKKIIFTRIYSQYVKIMDMSQTQLENYFDKDLLTVADKRKLNFILQLVRDLKKKEQELQKIKKEIQHQFSNQKRIRENLVVVKDDDNLRKDYLQKLRASEQHIERLLVEENKAKADIEELKDKLQDSQA